MSCLPDCLRIEKLNLLAKIDGRKFKTIELTKAERWLAVCISLQFQTLLTTYFLHRCGQPDNFSQMVTDICLVRNFAHFSCC